MTFWRKSPAVALWVALAVTPAAAQYVPSPGVQSVPYSTMTQPQAAQPAPATYQPSYAAGSLTSASALAEGLAVNRRRDLAAAQAYQAQLADPLARKVMTWAMVDVFGQELGLAALEQAARELKGWPREDAREAALERARTGYMLPGGPVPYATLQATTSSETHSSRVFTERRLQMNEHLRNGDVSAAYLAISNHGLSPDANYAEAESFAGWLALNKLKNPAMAERHFTRLDAAVKSPVSKARAAYWLGRTAEAAGDSEKARRWYQQGAQYNTAFYGLLAAERAGQSELVLKPDPVPTAADRAAVAEGEVFRAMRLLSLAGEKNLVRVFGLHLGDTVANEAQLAVLMDTIKAMGETELSLLAYRRAGMRNLILHERGYPLRSTPRVMAAPEPAFVLAITRQESQFDPRVRSSADARGMMQLLPGTGRDTARRIGIGWDEGRLWEADYNMQLGSAYLGQMSENFGGSYIMAAAGYNAGPGRPPQWVSFCGDPRSPGTDPLDFIECIPFSETRNYVMRVMENMTIYRARLNGGRAPLRLSHDLKRGASPYAGGYNTAR